MARKRYSDEMDGFGIHVRAMSDKLSWSQATMWSGSFRPLTVATRPEQLSVFF
jgi:hypothetical protein